MNNLPLEILKNSFISASVGFLIGLIFDIIYFCNLPIKIITNNISLLVVDIINILIFTLSYILILYYLNDGNLRGIFLFSEISGLVIYRVLFSKIVTMSLKFIFYPIKKILNFIFNIFKKTVDFFIQAIAKIEERLYNKNKI